MPISAQIRFSNNILQPCWDPDLARTMAVTIAPSQTITAGTVLGQVTTGGAYKAYASGNTDGSQVAKALAMYDMATDASGNITFGSQSGGGSQRDAYPNAPVYFKGTFATSDLTGLDSGAVTALGRLVQGTVGGGVLEVV